MKKKDLLEAIENLDNDAQVFVRVTRLNGDDHYADDVYVTDVVDDADLENEFTIVAHISE